MRYHWIGELPRPFATLLREEPFERNVPLFSEKEMRLWKEVLPGRHAPMRMAFIASVNSLLCLAI